MKHCSQVEIAHSIIDVQRSKNLIAGMDLNLDYLHGMKE